MSFCMKADVYLLILDTAPPLDQNKTLVIRSSDVILFYAKSHFGREVVRYLIFDMNIGK